VHDPEKLDRLTELTSIGAGHAATAFSQLAGREIRTRVPRLSPAREPAPLAVSGDEDWSTGVFFELEGCLGALVAILFQAPVLEELVRVVLGDAAEPPTAEAVEAVLMELGNILVSGVASAIADTLGQRLLPSIPMLAADHAGQELIALIERRGGATRIECEFTDAIGELGGLLVLVPDEVD
jgi:chemotaxis protein CheC